MKKRSSYLKSSREINFEKLYEVYFQDLFLYAKAITRSEELAKDVLSEVFTNLWNKGSFEKIKDIRIYLIVSVKNECIREISASDKKLSIFGTSDFKHESDIELVDKINPEHFLLEKELIEQINHSLESLSPLCKLVFEMSRRQNLTNREIALELDITESTVRTHLANAVKTIKNSIQSDHQFGEDYLSIALSLIAIPLLLEVIL